MGKKKKKTGGGSGEFLVCRSPKATRDYQIEQRMEAGIVLVGSEVKSLRARHADLEGAYCSVERGELFLHKMYVGPYVQAGVFGHDTNRSRKLLMHGREIQRLVGKLAQRGFALVPLRVYFKGRHAKVELGLGKGRKSGDDRESIKKKLDLREARNAMQRSRR